MELEEEKGAPAAATGPEPMVSEATGAPRVPQPVMEAGIKDWRDPPPLLVPPLKTAVAQGVDAWYAATFGDKEKSGNAFYVDLFRHIFAEVDAQVAAGPSPLEGEPTARAKLASLVSRIERSIRARYDHALAHLFEQLAEMAAGGSPPSTAAETLRLISRRVWGLAPASHGPAAGSSETTTASSGEPPKQRSGTISADEILATYGKLQSIEETAREIFVKAFRELKEKDSIRSKELSDKLAELEKEKKDATDSLDTTKIKLKQAERDLRDAKDERSRAQNDLKSCQEDLSNIREKLKLAQKQLASDEEKAAEKDKEFNKLRQELEACKRNRRSTSDKKRKPEAQSEAPPAPPLHTLPVLPSPTAPPNDVLHPAPIPLPVPPPASPSPASVEPPLPALSPPPVTPFPFGAHPVPVPKAEPPPGGFSAKSEGDSHVPSAPLILSIDVPTAEAWARDLSEEPLMNLRQGDLSASMHKRDKRPRPRGTVTGLEKKRPKHDASTSSSGGEPPPGKGENEDDEESNEGQRAQEKEQ